MLGQSKEVTRIYQGRVTACEIKGKEQPLSILQEHHQLYQDAVNYYLCAFAAMATDSGTPMGKMRERITAAADEGGVWDDFWRNGEARPGMKNSLARTLHADPETLSFAVAAERILGRDRAPAEVLEAAIDLVAKKCKGDVQQPGRTYSALFCDPDSQANFEFDETAQLAAQGALRLRAALYHSDAVNEVRRIAPELSLGWAGIKTQKGKFFEGEEAVQKLLDAVDYFEHEVDNPQVVTYLNSVPDLPARLEAFREKIPVLSELKIERNNRAARERKNATLLLKYFPDEFTIGLMKCFIREDGGAKSLSANPYGLSDDPIKLARGERGFIFPYFSRILTGNIWRKEFDICAFTEALKTINQFQQKCEEREQMRDALQADLDYMEGLRKKGSGISAEGADGDEELPLPVLAGDPRWELLKKLLKELGVSNSFTEDEVMEYGLSFRTIRSFSELRHRWQMILERSGGNAPAEELVRELHLFQQKNPERMGSADLFHKLAEPEYRDLWRADYPAGSRQSRDLLCDAVRYFDMRDRVEMLSEPIQFTPADAVYSSRQCDLKRLCVSKRPLNCRMVCTTQIAVRDEQGGVTLQDCILHYSAPRLLRDGLLGGESFRYLTPMIKALNPAAPAEVDFEESAVFLMPECDARGERRYLLNFSIGVPVENLHASCPERFSSNQFYFADSVQQMLLWPGIENGKNVPDWFLKRKPFVFVSVDLGQRTAGAITRIRVSPGVRPGVHAIRLGNDGVTDWYAERIYGGLLRLAGEDAKFPSKNGMEKERYGSRGRFADAGETAEARELCIRLCGNDLLEGDETFPEQNDRLLIAFRRAQAKWSRINRWLWMLNTPGKEDKALQEYSATLSEEGAMPSPSPAVLRPLLEEQEMIWRQLLPEMALTLARRILPLRDRIWKWESCRGENGESCRLVQEPARHPARVRICGQRGLSFARLEQLEEFRKRIQSLNRNLMRRAGAAPQRPSEMRELRIPDPCPDVLRKLNQMKENRINQTANLILSQALGLRLKGCARGNRPEEIHGEYERIPGVEPAAFLVLENLSRYRFSQDRSRFENSRLMKWSHRQIRAKLTMMATEIFGLPVLDVPAAYSSKFTAEGIPGFRAEFCSRTVFERGIGRRFPAEEQAFPELRDLAKKLEMLGKPLLIPKDGGPLFVPFCGSDTLIQADMNAAFNIGLRAAAHPAMLTIRNRIRVRRSQSGLVPARESKLAKLVFPETDRLEPQEGKETPDVLFALPIPAALLEGEGRQIYRFADPEKHGLTLISGKDLWRTVKKEKWQRCLALNRMRLEAAVRASEQID
ncbi:type V CRISPR-associated protein Cas12b [uncultured Victivallis sp.]|uniref:type V CRISPR-associated protein Cas12b n=1 Tax=uncultured Victivallis sp. TaxID=354118 RepID=UPI003458969F